MTISNHTTQALALQSTLEQFMQSYPQGAPQPIQKIADTVEQTIKLLDAGQIRVANPVQGQWQVNAWIKQAILYYFQLRQNDTFHNGLHAYRDKVPSKYRPDTLDELAASQVRVVPDAVVRYGAYVAPQCVLMPSFTNIGAYIDEGCMIDTWATVGSCAQIGKRVHVSGGAGIGGVLEPLQATPTIIEDDCFIGARSEIVEGVIVRRGAVIAMGTFIGQSTKIYNRETGEITRGEVPEGAVVVPGSLPGHNGDYHLNCAVIVKQVDAHTRQKVSINELLRDL